MNERAILKAINRWVRKQGRAFAIGWDYATWTHVYPQTASIFNQAAEALSGRKGRFMPTPFVGHYVRHDMTATASEA